MPFGSLLQCFKKTAGDMAEQYGGEAARDFVEDGIEKLHVDENQAGASGGGLDVDQLLQTFTGRQQGGLTSLFSTLSGSLGGLENTASEKGMDPNLIKTVLDMLGGGGSGGGSGGGGFDLGALINLAQSLTKGGGSSGGGGAQGFMSLIGGGSGGSSKIFDILIGLAKSFFSMQMGKNKSLQDWGKAGADKNDDNTGKWADSLVGDLVFPDKKPKDIVRDDEDPKGKDTNPDDVKGWFDGHPEIGKMQKDIFDDIFDTTDDDDDDRKDDVPLIPAPVGFKQDCSILDNASILFLNNKILLELRKSWRFLYSTKTNERDYVELSKSIQYEGPTLIIVKTTNETIIGAFAATSWADSEGGWIGNGDSFVFTLNPKMAVFYSTGQNENFMYLDQGEHGIGLGGQVGHFGLGIAPDLETLSYNEEITTFDLPPLPGGTSFEIEHIEVWGLGPQPRAEDERAKVHVRRPNLDIQDGNVDMDDLMGQIC